MPDSNPHWCYLPAPSIPGRLSPIFDVAQWLAYPFLFPVLLGYPEPYPLSSFMVSEDFPWIAQGRFHLPFLASVQAFLLFSYIFTFTLIFYYID